MSWWTGARVAEALGTGVPPGGPWHAISTDTRTLRPGSVFVALRGERFDGHDHLPAARDAGATLAVVRRGTAPVPGLPCVEVPDTLHAYGSLAALRRRAFPGPVVAIGGSNGKTSTRAMVAAVLGTRWRVHATSGNLNNLVGVPQTILGAPDHAQVLVLEAGTSLPGEMERHRQVIDPDAAVITTIAAEHLEGFGSLEGVYAEELALAGGVPLAVVGAKPVELGERAGAVAGRVIVAGLTAGEVQPDRVEVGPDGCATVLVDAARFRLPLPGRHLAANAMLAWALVREHGLDPTASAAALAQVRVPHGRTEVLRAGAMLVLDDSYNANPASFEAAIETARAMRTGRPLVVVAGTMRELGPASAALHAEVAELLVELAPELLVAVGEFGPALGAHAGALGDRLLVVPDAPAAAEVLVPRLAGNELVVLKASRGEALERIIPAITARAAPAT